MAKKFVPSYPQEESGQSSQQPYSNAAEWIYWCARLITAMLMSLFRAQNVLPEVVVSVDRLLVAVLDGDGQ